MAACDEALKACGGNVGMAAEHPAVQAHRGIDGDPIHHCRDDCPPWPFRWGGPGHRDGHSCSTHCLRHPDPRTYSLAMVRALVAADDAAIEGALSICGWDADRTIRFLREAGAQRAAQPT